MAEKAEKKPEEKAPAPAPAAEKKDTPAKKDKEKDKGGGLFGKMPVLLGMVMILEAVVLFAGFKFLGAGAKPAQAADLLADSGSDGKSDGKDGDKSAAAIDKKKPVVIKVTEFKAPNKKSGNSLLFDLKICVVAKSEYQKQIEDAIADKEPLIQDRVRTIVAESDPEKLSGGAEPGLETFRRQVKYQLDEIIGDGMIDEVLVPRMIPFRVDY
jgi:flagellar basal body-associated protein FliL